MSWFNRNSKKEESISIDQIKNLERDVSIQVKSHNKAADKVVAEAQEIADNFNRVINENNFSLVITVGAARKHR